MALAQRAGLAPLAGEHVRPGRRCGANPAVKVPGIVAGMAGGADSIDDLDLLRHGAMGALFGGLRAPSTLGSFLRSFTWGNVLQLGEGETGSSWRSWAAGPRCCPARTRSPSPASTRSNNASTGTTDKAPRSAPPRSRA